MTRNENLYGTKVVQIPPPEFVIFYNGEKDMPEETPLRLSDMYRLKVEEPKLQLEAVMLNISGSNNSRLKEACRTLKDYAVYTDKIRLYSKEQPLVEAVERAIDECIAEDVLNIFKELFQQKYQIESIILVDEFWVEGEDGNRADFESIEVNNTSCFNYRPVSGGESLSNHAYGLAIDINPQQNPYVTAAGVYSHENAAPYLDRNSGDPAVIVQGDICYSIFEKYGFSWGGLWQDPIDYQHFEKPMA